MSPLLLALMLQAAAPVPQWVETGPDGSGLTAAYNAASVARLDGTRRQAQLRLVADQPLQGGLVTAIITVELGCTDLTIIVIRNEGYDGAGTQLTARDVPPAARRTRQIPPGTPEARWIERVCAAPLP